MADILPAAGRLTAALRAIAAALASPDEAALLAAEPELAQAVETLRAVASIPPAERDAVAIELGRARAALARCRALGDSAHELLEAMLALHGGRGYDNAGALVAAPALGAGQMRARL